MPLVAQDKLTVDYIEQGRGEPVVLIHSSVSGNRQWRALIDALAERYRVLAVNLFGYGETTAWPGNTSQSLYAQASLILALPGIADRAFHLVGHSVGASVALKATLLLGERVQKLVLIEPNPSTSNASDRWATGRRWPSDSPTIGSATVPGRRCQKNAGPPSPQLCRRISTSGTPSWARKRRWSSGRAWPPICWY
jgi:pimeloyl-ACP methyl ester carboxylesterase